MVEYSLLIFHQTQLTLTATVIHVTVRQNWRKTRFLQDYHRPVCEQTHYFTEKKEKNKMRKLVPGLNILLQSFFIKAFKYSGFYFSYRMSFSPEYNIYSNIFLFWFTI